MEPLETYLVELRNIRASGAAVPETSGYGALANLLNEVGHKLKPRVRCFINLANTGAGIPDGGLFEAKQFDKAQAVEPLPGQRPARGALEVKPPTDNVRQVARSDQVMKYLEQYRQVLVTTYREFALVGFDADGKATTLETFSLAATEQEFWALAAQPRKSAATHGERLTEFLKRAMLRQSQIAAPQELAWFLASYAREARARVEEGGELPALVTTRQALEQALGMTFEGERGEHFFRSTLVQTLFYGLFAAWVFWAEQQLPTDAQARFRWREAAWYLHIPILSKLYQDFANPSQLGTMHLEEVLDWAGEALNRVDRTSFFATFEQQHAVQYFYEPFLEAFDPELRKQLGVWYTPPEIVAYMVARVDQLLRSELDIADGLADPRVVVLDPCCGTGAYLVEVLKKIAETLRAKGGDGLLAHDLKKAAMERVFGFEILPAPFVISHLQIGLALDAYGAPFADNGKERAGVYLTNALTGWEPPTGPKQHLLFPELEMERDAAADVKQKQPILVILGNPPYNGFAGAAMEEERDLVDAYRKVDKVAPPQGQGLNDLYVRFFRMAERRITEGAQGRGIVCFISNYSWLDGLSFTGMRERLLDVFDRIWIDNLHGDRIISEYAPDGRTSETVFAIQGKSPGIKIGTAIGLLARTERGTVKGTAWYRDFDAARADARRADLLSDPDDTYRALQPLPDLGLPLKPRELAHGYLGWPLLTQLFPTSFPGVKTSRDDALVDIDRQRLVERIRTYFDASLTDAQVAAAIPSLMTDTSGFAAAATRRTLVARGFLEANIVRYCYRPFDNRWLYWEPQADLLDRKREDYFPHVADHNVWLVSQQKPRREWSRPQVITSLGCLDLMDRGASCIPIHLNPEVDGVTLLDPVDEYVGNLTPQSSAYLDHVRANEFELLCHVVAILHAPVYAEENAGALRQDWPRVPMPASNDLFTGSQYLGFLVTKLLDVERPVEGVSLGDIRYELRSIGPIAKADGGQIDPGAGDLAVTAGWGHAGQGGVTMPGRGRVVERPYSDAELALMREGLAGLEMTFDQLISCLGGSCLDVYLNERACWRCVPSRVWSYTIGGYQVMKKWLSYRERPLLGRDLTVDEARYVTEMAHRIAAILLLEPALDENYARVKGATYAWPGTSTAPPVQSPPP